MSAERGRTLIGYRWLIDEASLRYQYVLEPGEYGFRASGAVSAPQVLVKRFEAGAVVSSVDHTPSLANRAFNTFDLRIALDAEMDLLAPVAAE